jgi:hypothetical protein
MKKRTLSPSPPTDRDDPEWLALERTATVEISSEDPQHPIEAALVASDGRGWRAAVPGPQTIRLIFDEPQRVCQVRMVIEERERERTQEFVLRARLDETGAAWREVVRQQFTFSPGGATVQREDYRLDLPVVSALELIITPHLSGGDARASLQQLRVAVATAVSSPV